MEYLHNSPGCQNCDAYHCDRCVYKNYIETGELNIPTIKQCELSYLERKYSMLLLERHQFTTFINEILVAQSVVLKHS